jgi:hypothetical protein
MQTLRPIFSFRGSCQALQSVVSVVWIGTFDAYWVSLLAEKSLALVETLPHELMVRELKAMIGFDAEHRLFCFRSPAPLSASARSPHPSLEWLG